MEQHHSPKFWKWSCSSWVGIKETLIEWSGDVPTAGWLGVKSLKNLLFIRGFRFEKENWSSRQSWLLQRRQKAEEKTKRNVKSCKSKIDTSEQGKADDEIAHFDPTAYKGNVKYIEETLIVEEWSIGTKVKRVWHYWKEICKCMERTWV